MKYDAKSEQRLMTEIWDPQIADDPYKFVLFAYPWGKAGTPLEKYEGPRSWQRDELQELAEHIKTQKEKIACGLEPTMWQKATASGRGIGKSTMVSWRSHWMMSTRLGSTTIITANTETQLRTRTFAEMTKWLTLSINGHWFDSAALVVKPAAWFEHLLKKQLSVDTGYYYSQGQLWSEENPDAFAGVHNPLGVQLIKDEASGIPVPIFNVSKGFFTEPVLDRYWDIYSNPRRNSGGFYDAFHARDANGRPFWRLRQVDSRSVEGTDRGVFDDMIAQHGIDSDVVRIEVLGQFPKQGNKQFIANSDVLAAQNRQLIEDVGAPLILGVDPARYGDDTTVLRWRQGRDARTIAPQKLKKRDNVEVADFVAQWIDKTNPDAVCIDAGNGTGVIDILKHKKYRVHEVWFGSTQGIQPEWANKRTQMYADVREWLKGGSLDGCPALFRDLTAPEYDFFGKAKDKVMLESKESMKSRGLPSPDDGDALALTFAVKVARRDSRAGRANSNRRSQAADVDYALFG